MAQRSVSDVMSRQVLTLAPETSFKQMVVALEGRGVDAAPVVDADGRLLGVVSASDLTCHDEQKAGFTELLLGGRQRRSSDRKARARTAAALMSSPARTVTPDATVCEALAQMQRAHVGRVVVVEDERVVGIVTRSDVLRVYTRDDDELRHDVERAVHAGLGERPARLDVEVRDGIALLRGWVERTSCAWKVAAIARDVPGIVDVDEDVLSDVDDTEVHELSTYGPFV